MGRSESTAALHILKGNVTLYLRILPWFRWILFSIWFRRSQTLLLEADITIIIDLSTSFWLLRKLRVIWLNIILVGARWSTLFLLGGNFLYLVANLDRRWFNIAMEFTEWRFFIAILKFLNWGGLWATRRQVIFERNLLFWLLCLLLHENIYSLLVLLKGYQILRVELVNWLNHLYYLHAEISLL